MARTITNTELGKRKRKIFLDHLSKTGKVKDSALLAGYAATDFLHRYRREHEDFAEEWDLAVLASGDILEAEAMRRAVDGIDEPVFYKGVEVSRITKYSDQLLMFLLKGARPSKYNARGGETNVNFKFGVAILPATNKDEAGWEESATIVHSSQKTIVLEEKPVENTFSRG